MDDINSVGTEAKLLTSTEDEEALEMEATTRDVGQLPGFGEGV